MTRIFIFRMSDGRRTTDAEQAIRWLSEVGALTPGYAQQLRDDYKAATADSAKPTETL